MKQFNSPKHTFWHHLTMIVYSEMVNLVWLLVGVVLGVAGWVILNFAKGNFMQLAVGLPLIITGASVALFKLHEILLVIAEPKRLKVLCIFCHNNHED